MNKFLLISLIVIAISSCKSEETMMEEVFHACNEIDTIAEKQFIDIDSIHRVFIPIIEEAEFTISIQKENPISIRSSHFGVTLGFCNESGSFDPPLCYDFSLFRYENFIEKEFPDSVITKNRNLSIVLDDIIRYCRNDETIGILYWGYVENLDEFIGRLYYSDFSSDEYFYLVGRLGSLDENDIARLNEIVDQIEIIRI